jgi:hypothetical protein
VSAKRVQASYSVDDAPLNESYANYIAAGVLIEILIPKLNQMNMNYIIYVRVLREEVDMVVFLRK